MTKKGVYIGTYVKPEIYEKIVKYCNSVYGEVNISRFLKEVINERLEKFEAAAPHTIEAVNTVCKYYGNRNCISISVIEEIVSRLGADLALVIRQLKQFMYERYYDGITELCFKAEAERICQQR